MLYLEDLLLHEQWHSVSCFRMADFLSKRTTANMHLRVKHRVPEVAGILTVVSFALVVDAAFGAIPKAHLLRIP